MLDDLIGYEIQKKKLVDNTEAFIKGLPANNVLLCGDAGTCLLYTSKPARNPSPWFLQYAQKSTDPADFQAGSTDSGSVLH